MLPTSPEGQRLTGGQSSLPPPEPLLSSPPESSLPPPEPPLSSPPESSLPPPEPPPLSSPPPGVLVLEELGDVDGPVVAMAFGPGLTLYATLLLPV